MTLKIIHQICIVVLVTLLCANQLKSAHARRDKGPIVLDENSWTQLLKGEWMVDFHAPWCPACKSLEPEWNKFADWSDDLEINIASADVTVNPGLSGRFLVSGLPTIYHVKDGIFRLYSGPRKHEALIDFIEKHGWKAIEPVSRLWAPDSLQMSFVAYSFRMSMALRDVHNYLVEEVGIPYYISYLIFALCTVTFGSLLGVLIVLVIDRFYPSRYEASPQEIRREKLVAPKQKVKKKKDEESDDSDGKNTTKDKEEEKFSSKDIQKEGLKKRGTGNS